MDELDEKVIHFKLLAEMKQGFKKNQLHLGFPNKLFFKNVALVASRCNSPRAEGPAGRKGGSFFFCVCVRACICCSCRLQIYK